MKIVEDIAFLRTQSQPIKTAAEAQALIDQIEKVLISTEHGIGLSAIQIGIPKQVGVIKDTDDHGKQTGKMVYLINPEVLEFKDEFINFQEGCLSCPGLFTSTKRFDTFIIKNHVIDDDQLREEIQYYYAGKNGGTASDGLTAIAVQHEIDHFNGKLIVDFDIQTEQVIRSGVKIGRNDPCPCGATKNGKPVKYKKCCMNKS